MPRGKISASLNNKRNRVNEKHMNRVKRRFLKSPPKQTAEQVNKRLINRRRLMNAGEEAGLTVEICQRDAAEGVVGHVQSARRRRPRPRVGEEPETGAPPLGPRLHLRLGAIAQRVQQRYHARSCPKKQTVSQ